MILPARSMLAPDGPVARRLQGFEPRPQQLEMATAVEDALRNRERLFVEAGTGTGKSFAYLLPAISSVLGNRGDKIIICTHTISLQEQLMEKDPVHGWKRKSWRCQPSAQGEGASLHLAVRCLIGASLGYRYLV